MTALIDFDRQYMLFAAGKLRGREEIKDDELTQALNDAMREWLSTKADYLGGKTPDEYFADMDAQALVDLLAEYCAAKMNVPEPLYGRISGEDACIPMLRDLAADGAACAAARATALRLLCDMNADGLAEICAAALLDDAESAETAAGWLKTAGYQVIDALKARYAQADYDGKAAILDVLACYPGADGTADMLIERLYNDRDRRAMYANMAGRLGDERLLEPLMRLSQLTDMEYFDYKEIVNAIEMLGGDPGMEREFYGDPDYEALRVADTIAVNNDD